MVAPIGPSGETVAANTSQRKTCLMHPRATSPQRMIQPKPCTHPRTSWAWSESPPIQTTRRAVKIVASAVAYRRTARKYVIDPEGTPLPAGEGQDQVGADP